MKPSCSRNNPLISQPGGGHCLSRGAPATGAGAKPQGLDLRKHAGELRVEP